MTDDDTRTLSDERRRLMHELEVERNQLIRNIETCRIRDIDRPFIDEWSLKDIVGHVASWEAEYVTALREIRAGEHPGIFAIDTDHRSQWSQDHVERKRDLNFWSILEQLRGGRTRLLDELEQFSDEALMGDGSLAGAVVRLAIEHDREHWHRMAAILAGLENEHRVRPRATG